MALLPVLDLHTILHSIASCKPKGRYLPEKTVRLPHAEAASLSPTRQPHSTCDQKEDPSPSPNPSPSPSPSRTFLITPSRELLCVSPSIVALTKRQPENLIQLTMNHFKRKDRRGAVHVQHNHLGPTVRHRNVPAVSTPPSTPAAVFSPMPKTTSSLDLQSICFDAQPIQLVQSEFPGDYYCSASPLKLDMEPCFNFADGLELDNREMSTMSSISTDTFSSAGSIFSSVSDAADALTVRNGRGHSRGPSPLSRGGRTDSLDGSAPSFVCLGPQCQQAFSSEKELNSHVKSCHTYVCNWAGCDQPSFSTRDGLIYHVKVQHLVICPSPGCTETSFQSIRILQSHISMAHPEDGKDDAKEWELPTTADDNMKKDDVSSLSKTPIQTVTTRKRKNDDSEAEMAMGLSKAKRQCQDRLYNVVEKRARKNVGKYLDSTLAYRNAAHSSND